MSVRAVREYHQILEDTLLGFSLPAWTHSKKPKATSTPKFYLFDLAVTHYLKHLERASDLLVGHVYAFDVKAPNPISHEDLKGLSALSEEKNF